MASFSGFLVTLRQMWGRRVTTQYPEQKRPKTERAHGRHVLNRYPDGMEKCIGCELCAGVCPARCIYVRGADNPPDDPVSPGERYGFIYEINYLRCIHCDLCVEACPTEAITETKMFEFSFTNRADAIYTRDELLVDDDGRAQRLPWEHWADDEDDLRSAWVRATAPSGNARYEGVVSWSPELGSATQAAGRGESVQASPSVEAAPPQPPAGDEVRGSHDPAHGDVEAGGAAEPSHETPGTSSPKTGTAGEPVAPGDADGDAPGEQEGGR